MTLPLSLLFVILLIVILLIITPFLSVIIIVLYRVIVVLLVKLLWLGDLRYTSVHHSKPRLNTHGPLLGAA